MVPARDAAGDVRGRRRGRQRAIAWVWLAIVSAFALWATLAYRSLAAWIGEWQYRHFGQNLPIVTLVLLVTVFGAPALLLLWRNRHRRRAVGDTAARALRAERRLLKLLAWVSGLSLLGALAVLGWTLTLPSGDGPARPVVPAMTAPGEGPVRLSGDVLATRTATFRQTLLFLRRTVYFAPVAVRDGRATRYFVEVPRGAAGSAGATHSGILKRDALPGAIVNLFEQAGIAVARPHYVLFASRASMLAPYYITAANWLIAALVTLLLALIQRRRLRRIMREHVPTSSFA